MKNFLLFIFLAAIVPLLIKCSEGDNNKEMSSVEQDNVTIAEYVTVEDLK